MAEKKVNYTVTWLGILLAFILLFSLPVYAIDRPDAGKINNSVEGRKTVLPAKPNVEIEVKNEPQTQSGKKEGYQIRVNGFHITGQSICSESKLQELIKDFTNRDLSLSDLEEAAGKITGYFRDQGFIVANAYIPAQDIKDGIVEITVLPGKYGNIDIRNHSRLKSGAAEKYLGSIKSGDYVKKAELERTLLLLSDTGGISIKASLAPGKNTGSTDLIIDINDTNVLSSEFSMDNYGNRFAGQYRRNLRLNFNNVGRVGDIISLGGNNAGNTESSTNNFYANYILPVGDKGGKLGVGYSRLHYTLGQDFLALDAQGTAKTENVLVSYPLVRSRDYNLYAQVGYDHNILQDRIYDTAFTDKHSNAWNFGLYGDNRDNCWGGGINSFSLRLTTGRLGIDGGHDINGISAKTYDVETARTDGSYSKASLSLNRLQYLNNRLNLFVGLTGQLASKNLDSSEKFSLGGANGVRAYPEGEACGDDGYLFTGELRWNMPSTELQLVGFLDSGHVTINKNTWTGAGINDRTLSGAGLGLIMNSKKDYTIRLDYAWKLGSAAATADTDKNGRWWLMGVQYF